MGKKLFTYGPRDVLRLLGLFFKFCMNCCVSFWSGMRSLFTKYSSVPIIEKERKYTELKTRLRLEPVLFWSWWLWRWLAFPIVPFPVVVLSLGSPWYKTPKINSISIKKMKRNLTCGPGDGRRVIHLCQWSLFHVLVLSWSLRWSTKLK